MGGHRQSGLSMGGADELEHLFVGEQWLSSPVLGDLGEETMFDGIPFGGAGRIMSDGDGEAEGVAQLSLDFGLPGPAAVAIAATRVGQNQQLGRASIAAGPFAFPPSGNRMGGEGRGVVGDADTNHTPVVRGIVDAVGDTHPARVGEEIVIVDPHGRAVPFRAGVFEVADHFPFLAIDADDRKTSSLEASPKRANGLELLIPVRTGIGGDLLAVDPQGEIHLVEKASDGVGRNRDIDLLQNLRDLLGRLPSPLQPGDGIPGRVVLQQNLDGLDYGGRFFSTRLRPPPVLRARSTSTS